MENDNIVVMYCNECIATFNDIKDAKKFVLECRANNIYINKKGFSIHIKAYI